MYNSLEMTEGRQNWAHKQYLSVRVEKNKSTRLRNEKIQELYNENAN